VWLVGCNGMVGNMLEIGFGNFGIFVLDNGKVGWGMMLAMWSPLHGMVDFLGL
jgi:hypothetical protein